MLELMTPNELFRRTRKGEKPDRLPLSVGNYNNFLFNYYGVTVDQFLESPDVATEVTVNFTLDFYFDL